MQSLNTRAYDDYDSGGTLNGRYVKVHDISEGSYGLVSLAKDTVNKNALVAVKYLYPPSYEKKKLYRSILDSTGRAASSPAKFRSKSSSEKSDNDSANEIAIHKILGHHPNIPDLIDSFDSCLVLEYCSKGDLYEAMQDDQGPTTSHDIKDVFSQIIEAIIYCHSKSVFHRDLKPENILIADDWTIKVCDWGLATTERIITNPAEFDVGSERYMAPELFDPDLEFYDASKVDVWSLGIILLTLVFQKNPFQVANYSDKRFLQFSANREALFDFFSTMTNEMFGALRFCLNLDPSNRDLGGFKEELKNLQYFTIDEEYIATHSDEDGDEEDDLSFCHEEDEHAFNADHPEITIQDEVFDFDKDTKDPEPIDPVFKMEQKKLTIVTPEQSPVKAGYLSLPKGVGNYMKDNHNNSHEEEEEEMPHNRRADALLSPSTQARPIPIGGGKQIRNTRKPFGVASYNKYNTFASGKSGQNHHSHTSKFNREDFFTPRSIFSHYMDKYGEQREQKEYSRSEKKRRRKPGRQSWKKRGSHTTQSAFPLHIDDLSSRPSQNSRRRRQSRVSMTSQGGAGSVFSPQTLNYFNTANASPGNLTDRSKSGQKYKPPFLRSPQGSRKSPHIHALSEGLCHLQFNDSEVFHLEDEVDGQELHANRRMIFENREFMSGHEPQKQDFGESQDSYRRYLTGKPDQTGRTSGKYVPPFRRGSHSGMGAVAEKRRSHQLNGSTIPIIPQASGDDEGSKSVPGGSWLLHKEWRALK